MHRNFRSLRLLALLALATFPLWGIAEPAGDVSDENRQLLEKWREDPQHYARLKRDLGSFRKMSPEQQERLRKLDRDLQAEQPAMRGRLKGVMERYADWMDKLSESERQSIEKAPDRKARLHRIRELREQQWVKRLPKAQQEQIKNAKNREEVISKIWHEEWEQRADWQVTVRHGDLLTKKDPPLPSSLAQLPEEVRRYVTDNLLPLLSKDEEKRLKEAEGKWPRYLRVLVELSDSHPYSVQGPIGPTKISALPGPYQDLLRSKNYKKTRDRLEHRDVEGHWPEFGKVARESFRGGGPFGPKFSPISPEFTPDRPSRFSSGVQVFLDKKLVPALDDEDRVRLHNAQDHWPDYPRTIVELARKHNLPIPSEKTLPGPFEFWDRYRVRSVTGPETVHHKRMDPFAMVP
ncbi:MAG: hypothetical protein K2R98_06935 [Gemmataceae bacterium]|nr:hypothetical protein [Gemmataceae bacterium]